MVNAQFTDHKTVPKHIAIIMDGNRRWAKQYGLPAVAGHAGGARRVREIVTACADRKVRYLTLFAFSTENWKRPKDEVLSLLGLLARYLQKNVSSMSALGVCFKVVGDITGFDKRIQALIQNAQNSTAHNDKITLTIAANYGGRWDVLHAVKLWQAANPDPTVDVMDEACIAVHLGLAHAPDPDLLTRTGGEPRIGNFMLWQLPYSLKRTIFRASTAAQYWPEVLDQAISWFGSRDRSFGGASLSAASKT